MKIAKAKGGGKVVGEVLGEAGKGDASNLSKLEVGLYDVEI